MRFLVFVISGALACAVSVRVTGLAIDDKANPVGFYLLSFGSSLLLVVGAFVATHRIRQRVWIANLSVLVGAMLCTGVLFRDFIHGSASALWGLAAGIHVEPPHRVYATSTCMNGYMVHNIPIVWGCFGRVGLRPLEYYEGYDSTLRRAFQILPQGTECSVQSRPLAMATTRFN